MNSYLVNQKSTFSIRGKDVVASYVKTSVFTKEFKLMDDAPGGIGLVVFLKESDWKMLEKVKSPLPKSFSAPMCEPRMCVTPSECPSGPGMLG